MKEDRGLTSTWFAKTEAEFKLGWRKTDVYGPFMRRLPLRTAQETGETTIYADKKSTGYWCSFRDPTCDARGGESGKTRAIAATNLIRARLREIEKDAAAEVVTA